MRFTRGLKDGLPIALGYVPVAFAFAIRAVDQGFPAWFPVLVSATNFTGTGQFLGTDLIAAGASLAVLFATMLIINIRYLLMSVSLAQNWAAKRRSGSGSCFRSALPTKITRSPCASRKS